MAVVERLAQCVMERLDYPAPSPSMGVVLAALYDRNQFYVSQMKNRSDEGLLLDSFEMTFSGSGVAEPISASAPDFEGAFQVFSNSALYSDRREREIPIVRMQDRNYVTTGGGMSDPGGRIDSVDAVTFYRDQMGWQALPVPLDGRGDYVVWYEPSVAAETAMKNTPQMPASFHNLLAISTAIDLLGQCRWPGTAPGADTAARAAGLGQSMTAFKEELAAEWKVFILLVNAEHSGQRDPYESEPGFWSTWRGGQF